MRRAREKVPPLGVEKAAVGVEPCGQAVIDAVRHNVSRKRFARGPQYL
jgi:hypothetical protein